MLRFDVLDNNDEIIYSANINSWYDAYSPSEKVQDLRPFEYSEALATAIDYGISVFLPFDNGNDFLIQHLSPYLLKRVGIDSLEEVRGCLFSKTFPLYVKCHFLDYLSECYKTGKSIHFKMIAYKEGHLAEYYKFDFVKSGNKVFILAKDESNLKLLKIKEESIFNNSLIPMVIIQEGNIVRANKAYINYFNKDESTIINSKFNLTHLKRNNEIIPFTEIYNNIINKKIPYDIFLINWVVDGSELWFNISFNYTQFNDKDAVIIYINDVTESEKINQEAHALQTNLDIILNFTKSAIIFKENGRWYRSNEFYELLELEVPDKYIPYRILDNYVLDEYSDIFHESHENLSPDKDCIILEIGVKTAKDNIKYFQLYLMANFDEDGNLTKFMSFMRDISPEMIYKNKLNLNRGKLSKLNSNMDIVQDISKIAICDWNPKQGYKWSDQVYYIFEISPEEMTPQTDLLSTCAIDDLANFNRKDFVDEEGFSRIVKIRTYKGNIKYLFCYANYELDENGELLPFIGFAQDITLNYKKTLALRNSNYRNEILLKEIHHRVKNNLQIILSLMDIDKRFNKENYESIFEDTKNRIKTMAIIHESIYSSSNLSDVNVKTYIESIITYLFKLYDSKIKVHYNVEDINLDMNIAIPLSLITNEIITNAIKYAFPNEEGNLFIDVHLDDENIIYEVKDDGVGLSEDFNKDDTTSLGMIIIDSLINQIDGEMELINNNGLTYIFKIPLINVNKQYNSLPDDLIL